MRKRKSPIVAALNGSGAKRPRKVPADAPNGAKRPRKKADAANGTERPGAAPTAAARRPFEAPIVLSSMARGQRALQWLLSPISAATFFEKHFERLAVHVPAPAGDTRRFASLLGMGRLRKLVRSGALAHGRNVDVTSYTEKGGRETHTGGYDTKTTPDTWKMYEEGGCSLRLLRPQAACDALWSLCGLLEEALQCGVGANAYLTPRNSQGFAPHFDDIDAFVCQIDGAKRWKVYAPAKDGSDHLPRTSSIDFTAEEMRKRKVLLDVTLRAGDMLYLPRGAIHQARAVDGAHSLHITLSAHQRWTWADLLLHTMHDAVRSAAATEPALRRTLPLRFASYIGMSTADKHPALRARFDKALQAAMRKVAKCYPIDAAADAMAARFLGERLPPPPSLLPPTPANVRPTLKSRVRAAAQSVARVVMGKDELPRIVHCLDNARAGGADARPAELTCTPDEAAAVHVVLSAYPEAVRLHDLPLEKPHDRVELVEGLLEMGIVHLVD